MKMGQKIVILISVLLVCLMIFMIFGSDVSINKTFIGNENMQQKQKPSLNKEQDKKVKSIGLVSDQDIKMIRELKEGVKTDKVKVSQLYLVGCSSCHGDEGKGIIAPPINGKSKEYILDKLKDYKEERISNTLMTGIFKNIDEKTLTILAEEISEFPK